MPVTSPYLRKADNGVFYIHWSDGPRSRRESTGLKERGAAERALTQWRLVQENVSVRGPQPTIAELWKTYVAKHVAKHVAAPDTLKWSWANLKKAFGGLLPSDVDQAKVDAYEGLRASGLIGKPSKPSTVRRELLALRACLNWSADPKRKLLSLDAVPAFDLPSEGKARDRWLTQAEIRRLLDAARALNTGPLLSRGELFLWLAIETAARKTAILTLTWDRVDFETRVIHYADPEREVTKKRRAAVPISAALLPVLERAYEEKRSDLVMIDGGEVWATVQIIAEQAGFGERAARRARGEDVEPRKAGEKPKRTGISPHVLRHTAATHMARRGVSLWIIAKVLGNSLAMVEKVYAKHAPEDLRAAVDLISSEPKREDPVGIVAQNARRTASDASDTDWLA